MAQNRKADAVSSIAPGYETPRGKIDFRMIELRSSTMGDASSLNRPSEPSQVHLRQSMWIQASIKLLYSADLTVTRLPT